MERAAQVAQAPEIPAAAVEQEGIPVLAETVAQQIALRL
jgi:hypothetical protein